VPLQEDEKLDELRIQAVREEEELKVRGRVDSAVVSEQVRFLTSPSVSLLLMLTCRSIHLFCPSSCTEKGRIKFNILVTVSAFILSRHFSHPTT
jgi:hypothetical protein